jgi:hypothetical protein
MDLLEKLASSLDDALYLILGEDLPLPTDKYIGLYSYWHRY